MFCVSVGWCEGVSVCVCVCVCWCKGVCVYLFVCALILDVHVFFTSFKSDPALNIAKGGEVREWAMCRHGRW
jgi:hypothetical protein